MSCPQQLPVQRYEPGLLAVVVLLRRRQDWL